MNGFVIFKQMGKPPDRKLNELLDYFIINIDCSFLKAWKTKQAIY